MRYQDYVIKDGQFIGEFEKMYQDCEDPWRQSQEAEQSYSRSDTVVTIKRLGLKNILEIGCGLGHFTNYLARSCDNIQIAGMDISATAIQKAAAKYPHLEFFQGNVKDIDIILKPRGVDTIIFSEIMWYILNNLDDVLRKIREYYKHESAGGYLIVNQTFYNGGQSYGKEFFTNEDEMIRYIGWDVVFRAKAASADNTVSYETHTVFRIKD